MSKPVSLKEFIEQVRVEINAAVEARPPKGVQFDVEAVEVELTTTASKTTEGGISLAVFTGKHEGASEHTQIVRLRLRPRLGEPSPEDKAKGTVSMNDRDKR